jgi:hypothetical protein
LSGIDWCQRDGRDDRDEEGALKGHHSQGTWAAVSVAPRDQEARQRNVLFNTNAARDVLP